MMHIGIMQGRLVPPVNHTIQAFPRHNWAEEFPRAAAAKLDCIEWIYDMYGADVNPLGADAGILRLRELSAQHGVSIRSLCADYFMEQPLVRATEGERRERMERLEWLLGQCQQLSIGRIVLPFVDQSAITTASEATQVVECLRRVVPVAEQGGVELHLETSLAPEAFRTLLLRLPHACLQVTYDAGNSAALGYRPQEEFAAYGGRIGSVHIKDRKHGGGTVALGTGDTDFAAVFSGLQALRYTGDFILQVARGVPGHEVALAEHNRAFVVSHWSEIAG
jgi:L-ribulose-5-phosphate 3-epimerase